MLKVSIKKTAPPTKEHIDKLRRELTSVIVGHVNALEPWTFYEVIDQFLGPWGPSGYPIGYGKYYCVLFNANEKLQDDPESSAWVAKTTTKLQELLRDAILQRFQANKLGSITEPELRAIAFDTHPAAYDGGGLAKVVLVAPELLPTIMLIPKAQYIPFYGNSIATAKQIVITLVMISDKVIGGTLAAMAGPAHTGIFQKASRESGPYAILAEQRKNAQYQAQFDKLLSEIRSGRLDRIVWLEELTDKLKTAEFADSYWLDVARKTIQEADARKAAVAAIYRSVIKIHPETRVQIDKNDPGWAKY